jgi:asparagine synthase (glutamine-hydrolysing)
MCGIAGVVSLQGAPLRHPGAPERMRETLVHRGPDGAGSVEHPGASLQIRRLAIVDLQRGDQPFTSPDGLVSIVCNGEIYNSDALRRDHAAEGYPFRSRSDVESVLPLYLAYGPDAIRRLEGMFGLAIWDARAGRLLLARDRSGEKPVFYAEVGNELAFGSEPKALLAYPGVSREIEPLAVALYAALGYVPQPFTMHRAIRKLPPGCFLTADASGITVRPYWDAVASSARPDAEWPFDSFLARSALAAATPATVLETLRAAVGRELMADVPVGIFTSGGLDSSLLVALAAEHFKPGGIRTYTIAFGDPSYDESGPAALVTRHFRTEHRAVPADPENLRRALDIVAERLDEPLGDPAVLPTFLLSEAAHRDVKVILSGEGADELFGGYPTYLGHRAAAGFAALPGWLQGAVRRAAFAWPPSPGKVTLEFLAKRFVSHAAQPVVDRHFEWFGALGPAALGGLLGPAAAPAIEAARAELARRGADAAVKGDPLAGILLLDFLTYLPDDLLTKVDRATMLASIEARAPFLDREVMELALALPSARKVRGLSTKVVLNEAARPLLPAAILRRRKRGLSVPIASWINQGLRVEVDRLLAPERCAAQGWFRPEAVGALLAEHRAGAANHARRLWPLVMFQRWHDRWA